jgi:hypothetical protein
MSVNEHKFGAICNHFDVLAFENGAVNGENAKSAVRGHPRPELYSTTNRQPKPNFLSVVISNLWALVLAKKQ